MATLSLTRCYLSQVNDVSIEEGQLIVCDDTGDMFLDISSVNRIALTDEVKMVSQLPLVPVSDKLYIVNGESIYMSYNGQWVNLLDTPSATNAQIDALFANW